MAQVTVEEETEEPRGWRFRIRIEGDETPAGAVDLRLDWSDYDLWSRGRTPPSRVAAALVEFLLARAGEKGLRRSFDAARVRREHPDVDESLPGLL